MLRSVSVVNGFLRTVVIACKTGQTFSIVNPSGKLAAAVGDHLDIPDGAHFLTLSTTDATFTVDMKGPVSDEIANKKGSDGTREESRQGSFDNLGKSFSTCDYCFNIFF